MRGDEQKSYNYVIVEMDYIIVVNMMFA